MAANGESMELLDQLEERVYGELIGAVQESGAPERVQREWVDRAMRALNEVEASLAAIDGLEREVRDFAGSPRRNA